LLKPFVRHRGDKICPDERTNEPTNAADGQLENIRRSPTLSGSENIKLKSGFVAFFDLWPGNGTGLFLRK